MIDPFPRLLPQASKFEQAAQYFGEALEESRAEHGGALEEAFERMLVVRWGEMLEACRSQPFEQACIVAHPSARETQPQLRHSTARRSGRSLR